MQSSLKTDTDVLQVSFHHRKNLDAIYIYAHCDHDATIFAMHNLKEKTIEELINFSQQFEKESVLQAQAICKFDYRKKIKLLHCI